MGQALSDTAAQSLVLFRKHAGLKPPKFLLSWKTETIERTADLFTNRATDRILVVVHEEDLTELLESLKQQRVEGQLGIFVFAEDPIRLQSELNTEFPILGVFNHKDLSKLEIFLLNSLRGLSDPEFQKNQKVNHRTLENLNQIFIELSTERDPQQLLASILMKSLELSNAETGTFWLVSEQEGELHFKSKVTATDNNQVTIQHMQAKASESSICGYVVLTGKVNNLRSVSDLKTIGYPQVNSQIDHVREGGDDSVLTVPFKNGRNEIIGVLQLVNRRESQRFVPFDKEDESVLLSFATQATVCLENIDLYADVQKLFDGFVKASIAAIESRDPSTGGHSERVARMTVALARATSECTVGIYRSVRFKEEEIRELEYASLLHDFGKIGIREEVLVKAKKLYGYQLDAISDRIKVCKAAVRIAQLEKMVKTKAGHDQLEEEYRKRLAEIEEYWQMILKANEPAVLQKENIATLEKIRNEKLLLPDGAHIDLLTDEEYAALSVKQGSLTKSERLEIESHVRHTYQFLKMIPWTKDFRHLTEIAYCHHEKLDGSGYPRGLLATEIPLQSKIMTIADIYDALTAADRWYKEAVPSERALDILRREVGLGKLDPVLFDIFIEKKIYELTKPRELTQVA